MRVHCVVAKASSLRSWIWPTSLSLIHMKLEEMGLDGPARVVGVDACLEIEPDDESGRNVVTVTMARS